MKYLLALILAFSDVTALSLRGESPESSTATARRRSVRLKQNEGNDDGVAGGSGTPEEDDPSAAGDPRGGGPQEAEGQQEVWQASAAGDARCSAAAEEAGPAAAAAAVSVPEQDFSVLNLFVLVNHLFISMFRDLECQC